MFCITRLGTEFMCHSILYLQKRKGHFSTSSPRATVFYIYGKDKGTSSHFYIIVFVFVEKFKGILLSAQHNLREIKISPIAKEVLLP